jgi:uncharacterized membrane-anchored protein YhcB (DUF1043 family)
MLTTMEQNALKKQLDELTITLEARFNRIDERFEAVDKRFDAMYEYMSVSFKQIHQDMRAIHGRMTDVEEKDIDTEDRLTGVEKAVDKDSIQLMDHQKRLRRLEKKEKKA